MVSKLEKKTTKIRTSIRVIAKSIVIALFLSMVFISLYFLFIDSSISRYTIFLNNMSIGNKEFDNSDVSYNIEKKELNSYPAKNSKYGTLIIDKVNIKLPIYFGDSYKNLAKGIGHFDGSLFPGEGGSIVYAGHNTKGFLYNLYDVKVNDYIEVKTIYGYFKYKVYKIDIINEKEDNKLPLDLTEETLMIYTCYPHTIGRTNKRLVVYSKLVEAKYE